ALAGRLDRYPEAMAELARRNVDTIVAPGQKEAIEAAREATGSIPIVMVAVDYDPLALGYVRSLARPGGNVTGVFFRQIELAGKRLELLKETIPGMSRAAVLWDKLSADQLKATAEAASSLRQPIQPIELRDPP